MEACYFPVFNTNAKIRSIDGSLYIFDIVRKKYVRLTPEEWTRQHLIHYLIYDLAYSKALIRIEKKMQGHYSQDRPDIVVYNNDGMPLLVAECKASHVALTLEGYTQLTRYNRKLQAPIWVITNGIQYGCWKMEEGRVKSLDNIPAWS